MEHKMNRDNEVNGNPALSTSQISRLLGFPLSAKFIEHELGIAPNMKTKTSFLWFAHKYPEICERLSSYCLGASAEFIVENYLGRSKDKR
jgi:hypothetical protein